MYFSDLLSDTWTNKWLLIIFTLILNLLVYLMVFSLKVLAFYFSIFHIFIRVSSLTGVDGRICKLSLKTQNTTIKWVKNLQIEQTETAQSLRAIVDFGKSFSLVFNTHVGTQSHVCLQFKGVKHPLMTSTTWRI